MGQVHDGVLHLSGNQHSRELGGGVHQHDGVVDQVLHHLEVGVGLQLLNIRTTSLSIAELTTR